MTWPDGDKYEGQWKDDEKSGHGILIDANGTFSGNFANDKRNGQGT